MLKIVKQFVWAVLQIVSPTYYWRTKASRLLANPKEKELLLAPLLCDPAKTSIDVGAADGIYAVRLCANSKRVIAVEPQPKQARRLRELAAANKLQLDVRNIAVSDKEGEVTLRIPKHDLGRSTIEAANQLPQREVSDVEEVVVPMHQIDSLGFDDIGFIKVDVEGHELAVLRGAIKTLKQSMPTLLLELEDRHCPGITADAKSLLTGMGYDGYFLSNGRLCDIDEFNLAVHQSQANIPKPPNYETAGRSYINNFIFCTPSQKPKLVAALGSLEGKPF